MLAIKPKSKSRPRATRLTNRRWTFDELAAEVPESNQPMELWDGEPIMSPSPSFFYQQIAFQFQKRLDAWVTEHRLGDRKSTRLNSSHLVISYAVFCLKK